MSKKLLIDGHVIPVGSIVSIENGGYCINITLLGPSHVHIMRDTPDVQYNIAEVQRIHDAILSHWDGPDTQYINLTPTT